MKTRRRLTQYIPLTDRLLAFARAMRDRAALVPPGPERDELLKKAQKAEAAQEMADWVNSSGLQPPK
jgi:hypothetical protein